MSPFSSEYPSYIVVNGEQTSLLLLRMNVQNNLTFVDGDGSSPTIVPGRQGSSLVATSDSLPEVFQKVEELVVSPSLGGRFALSFRISEHEEYEGNFWMANLDISSRSPNYTFAFEGLGGDSHIVLRSLIPALESVEEPGKRHDRWNLVK